MPQSCPFCFIEESKLVAENSAAIALQDKFPLADGHTLVIPRRHLASIFDLSDDEQAALWRLVAQVRARLRETHAPDGCDIGVNDGAAAGQTVPHAHVHVIPRYHGDVSDPRGGIRFVIPNKAAYWETPS